MHTVNNEASAICTEAGLCSTIFGMDTTAQEAFGKIIATVRDALAQKDIPGTVAAALDSVWEVAQVAANDINVAAESVGCASNPVL